MKPLAILIALVLGLSSTASCLRAADERDERIRALEKRVEQLERLLQAQAAVSPSATNAEPPPKAAKAAPVLSIGASGFAMQSADTNFALRIGGLVQLDSHWGDEEEFTDTFLLRRARLNLEGTVFRDFDFRLTPEFAGSNPSLRDAWLNYRHHDALQLRFGKMKSPGSLERRQGAANTLFIERALPSLLWPVREVGVLVHGSLWSGDEDVTRSLAVDGLASYDLGVFNGAGDGRAAGNRDFDSDKAIEARLFVHPFLKSNAPLLRRLGLGAAGGYGETEGDLGLPDEWDYDADVTADGRHWRVGPQAYWYWGPFGLLGEYAISSQRLKRQSIPTDSLQAENRAWQLTASWLLTGEEATFKRVRPRRNFDPRQGRWGAVELVVRYASLDFDDDLFPGFADPAELPTRVSNWGAGINWYLNRNIRAGFNYNHYEFKGGESGSIEDLGENVFSTRVQLAF